MRLRGTGTAPEGQYAEGQIFDVLDGDELQAQSLIDLGWAEKVPPEEDPGRTPLQIANSAVRGDELAHPVERQIALDHGYIDETGQATDTAYAAVHGQRPDATPEDYEADVKFSRKADAFGQFTERAAASAAVMEARAGIESEPEPLDEERREEGGEEQAQGVPYDATAGAVALADQEGVDLNDVEGTGVGGRITKEDVQNHLDQQQS